MTGRSGETAVSRSGDGSIAAAKMPATRAGRWGIRQFVKGEHTGGGTIGMGWDTEQAAIDANPPQGESTYEPFERWCEVIAERCGQSVLDFGGVA